MRHRTKRKQLIIQQRLCLIIFLILIDWLSNLSLNSHDDAIVSSTVFSAILLSLTILRRIDYVGSSCQSARRWSYIVPSKPLAALPRAWQPGSCMRVNLRIMTLILLHHILSHLSGSCLNPLLNLRIWLLRLLLVHLISCFALSLLLL